MGKKFEASELGREEQVQPALESINIRGGVEERPKEWAQFIKERYLAGKVRDEEELKQRLKVALTEIEEFEDRHPGYSLEIGKDFEHLFHLVRSKVTETEPWASLCVRSVDTKTRKVTALFQDHNTNIPETRTYDIPR